MVNLPLEIQTILFEFRLQDYGTFYTPYVKHVLHERPPGPELPEKLLLII